MTRLKVNSVAAAVSAALATLLVTNNSGTTYNYAGYRVKSLRELEADEPQRFELLPEKAQQMKAYLHKQNPGLKIVIIPPQSADDDDTDDDQTGAELDNDHDETETTGQTESATSVDAPEPLGNLPASGTDQPAPEDTAGPDPLKEQPNQDPLVPANENPAETSVQEPVADSSEQPAGKPAGRKKNQ